MPSVHLGPPDGTLTCRGELGIEDSHRGSQENPNLWLSTSPNPLTPVFQDPRHLRKWVTGSLLAGWGPARERATSEAPLEWAGCSRAQLSEGLVMLPQPGLQELIRQVVSCNDPHDLSYRIHHRQVAQAHGSEQVEDLRNMGVGGDSKW